MIPKDPHLYQAQTLFKGAEHEAAPEGWAHIANGLMLDSTPSANRVTDAYACAIVDGMFHDPETWDGYGAGYSAPVIIRAIREARREDALPSPGRVSSRCARDIGHGSGAAVIPSATSLRFARMPKTS
jgi:hypothetical protein